MVGSMASFLPITLALVRGAASIRDASSHRAIACSIPSMSSAVTCASETRPFRCASGGGRLAVLSRISAAPCVASSFAASRWRSVCRASKAAR